jgi:hypothetical protein
MAGSIQKPTSTRVDLPPLGAAATVYILPLWISLIAIEMFLRPSPIGRPLLAPFWPASNALIIFITIAF